jgi:hypothetical protein
MRDPDPGRAMDIRRSRSVSPAAKLKTALREMGEVLEPGESEEPILAPSTRAAVFEWMAELRSADELAAVGLKARATALLHGPPGCGKTTLAHHFAARVGIPMVLVGAESVLNMYLGESEKAVDRLFRTIADSEIECLLFLDEIDAIGGKRDGNNRGGADNARSSILTVLLRHIERFRGLLIAATNRPRDLDPALWRRFNLQVTVDLPGDDERWAILRRYGAPYVFDDDDLDLLCGLTAGASPALLRGLMEGIKRSLVIAPRVGRDVSDPAVVFQQVISTVMPPPEIDPPELWLAGGPKRLSGISWPPVRENS